MQPHANRDSSIRQPVDCLLISPPHWYPLQPYLALPALQGYLRQEGFSTAIADLNVLTLDHFLKKDTLEALFQTTEERLFKPGKKPASETHRKSFRKIALLADKVISQVETALQVLRGPQYYDYRLRHEATKIIYLANKIVSVCFYPTNYTLNSFSMRFNHTNPEQLLAATEASEENPFLEFAHQFLTKALPMWTPRAVGVNITSGAQVIGGLTIARILKAIAPDTHVVVGGSYFSRLVSSLQRFPHIFKYVDSVIVFEGEIALAKLLDCVINNGDWAAVPHHVWQDKRSGEVQANLKPAVPDVTLLPVADYEGMALDKYLLPEPVLSVFSSRGCYWNQCAFCDHGFCYQNQYRQRPIESVVEDMQVLAQRHGCTCFDIVDEAIKPEAAEALSRQLLSRGLNFNWMSLARIDKNFTADRFTLMRNAGCRLLSFGVESNDDRVLQNMRKGTTAELNLRILTRTVQAGIWAHIMIIFGFPGETEDQAQTTMALITEHHDAFHDGGVSLFQLGRQSRIMHRLKQYGIQLEADWQNALDLAYEITLPYQLSEKGALSRAKQNGAQFQKRLIEKKGSFERTLSLLYAIRYNTTHFEDHFETNKKYDMHRQLGELDIANLSKDTGTAPCENPGAK